MRFALKLHIFDNCSYEPHNIVRQIDVDHRRFATLDVNPSDAKRVVACGKLRHIATRSTLDVGFHYQFYGSQVALKFGPRYSDGQWPSCYKTS